MRRNPSQGKKQLMAIATACSLLLSFLATADGLPIPKRQGSIGMHHRHSGYRTPISSNSQLSTFLPQQQAKDSPASSLSNIIEGGDTQDLAALLLQETGLTEMKEVTNSKVDSTKYANELTSKTENVAAEYLEESTLTDETHGSVSSSSMATTVSPDRRTHEAEDRPSQEVQLALTSTVPAEIGSAEAESSLISLETEKEEDNKANDALSIIYTKRRLTNTINGQERIQGDDILDDLRRDSTVPIDDEGYVDLPHSTRVQTFHRTLLASFTIILTLFLFLLLVISYRMYARHRDTTPLAFFHYLTRGIFTSLSLDGSAMSRSTGAFYAKGPREEYFDYMDEKLVNKNVIEEASATSVQARPAMTDLRRTSASQHHVQQ
ncbi:hypothetical protein BGZ54_001727 [Gamsiella multidivaricata]|nr:hypothetical protein BGZ54_001727 [Gamsiella multidivaricata]